MKKYQAFLLSGFFTLMFLFIYFRGLFEFAGLAKITAYAVSTLPVLIMLGFTLILYGKRGKSSGLKRLLPALIFIAAALLSALATALKYHAWIEPFLFASVMLFIYIMFLYISQLETGSGILPGIFISLFVIASVLFASALWEQSPLFPFMSADDLGNLTRGFPGHSSMKGLLVRPASLTGSMLHYPIIIPLMGAIIMRFGKKWWKTGGVLFFLAPFFAVSRSGILIVFISCILYGIYRLVKHFFMAGRNNDKTLLFRKSVPVLISAGVVICVALIYIFLPPVHNFMQMLQGRLSDTKDSGNTLRYKIWLAVIEKYLKTNLFIGEMTGFYTNITGNMLGTGRFLTMNDGIKTAESGFLEILTAFGIAGALAYYGTMVMIFIRVFFKKKERFLGFVFLAAVIQTLFYQSVEVMPFVFTLALIPFFVNNRPGDKIEAPLTANLHIR